MSLHKIEDLLKRSGIRPIENTTQKGTYSIVDQDKFTTKGIANRDNARWKRAQFIVVEFCSPSNVQICVNGFTQFSEACQFLIIANSNQAFNGYGHSIDISQIAFK